MYLAKAHLSQFSSNFNHASALSQLIQTSSLSIQNCQQPHQPQPYVLKRTTTKATPNNQKMVAWFVEDLAAGLGINKSKNNLPSYSVATTEKSSPNDYLGLSFFESSGEIHILDIDENGLFADSNLKVGQTIVAVNGKDSPTSVTAVESLLGKAEGPLTIVAVGEGIKGGGRSSSSLKKSAVATGDLKEKNGSSSSKTNFWTSIIGNYTTQDEKGEDNESMTEGSSEYDLMVASSPPQSPNPATYETYSSPTPGYPLSPRLPDCAGTPGESYHDYQPTPRAKIPDRLVDYFCVIGPQLKVEKSNFENPTDLQFEAKLVDCYPPTRDDMEFPDYLPMFCFPGGYHLQPKKKSPTISTFMLTSGAGHRLYGSAIYLCESLPLTDLCELFWESSLELPSWLQEGSFDMRYFLPKCLVVLSHHAFYSVQCTFLQQLLRISQTRKVPLPIERYIANFVHDVPLPAPGQTKVRWNVFTKDSTVTIERPGKNELPLVNFSYQPLFRALSVSNILVIWGVLLQEGRVVLRSENMALLTPVAEGLMSLLFPLTWQGMYVPVLPSHMVVDVLDAPVPFLVGLVGRTCPQPDGVIVCDLDQDVVQLGWDINHKPQRLPRLPRRLTAKLKEEIESVADPLYLIPQCGVKGRITSAAFELLENSKRESYAPMIKLRSVCPKNTHRRFILEFSKYVQKQKSLSPNDFCVDDQGQIFVSAPECSQDRAETDDTNSSLPPSMVGSDEESEDGSSDGIVSQFSKGINSSFKQTVEEQRFRAASFMGYTAPSPYTLVVSDEEMEKKKHGIAKGLYDLDEAMSERTRYIFIRFFATLFRRYKGFVREQSFQTKEFLQDTDLSAGSQKFVETIIKSQMFERFLYECPDRRKLFDELIILQQNAEISKGKGKFGAKIKLEKKKEETPFLNMLPQVTYDVVPSAPCHVGIGVGRTFTYEGFPKLDPEELVANNNLDPISSVCHGTLCSPTWWLSDE